MIDVEIAYAQPDKQTLLILQVDKDCTAIEAVRLSGIVDEYPEINLQVAKLGIFSKACDNDYKLKAGDRVEIYRPLLADPKEIRKRRAAEMAAAKMAAKAATKKTLS
ncbi:MAG: RnfH family protein [Gammaproteobacteria bacterium]|nr:MAG: RnfH family protein [Gammaproteobacteria bacterium]